MRLGGPPMSTSDRQGAFEKNKHFLELRDRDDTSLLGELRTGRQGRAPEKTATLLLHRILLDVSSPVFCVGISRRSANGLHHIYD